MRAVGVELDDAAAANDVQVGADLAVARDWMDAQRRVSHILPQEERRMNLLKRGSLP